MLTIEQLRTTFKLKLHTSDFVIDKTGAKMIEIINANFIANEDLIFGTHSHDWYAREKQWYLSQSLNVNDIPPPIPTTWKAVADPDGYINSNYGWAIFSYENCLQYDYCLHTLQNHSESRRAIMIYNRPSMQYDYNLNGRSDFMCMQNTQHFIRNDVLTTHVNIRSNDAIFGYKGDYNWVDWVHNKLYNDLLPSYNNLKKGSIYWNAMSLHVYEKHFHLVK